ncbi:hypothetical protein V6N13_077976 [Hibiscus sabdariffa]|uniref:EF-hand domain-containing protein n=1 Tax=Hibiscus sabdariffa TaxID=183260 RepID=A0ABR2RMF1_9ROSI
MGNASSMLTQYDIEEVQEHCNYLFSGQEIVSLYERFCELDRNAKGYITAEEMLSVPEFAMNPLSKRLVEMVDGFNFKDFVAISGLHLVLKQINNTKLNVSLLSSLLVVHLQSVHVEFDSIEHLPLSFLSLTASPDPTSERRRLHSRDSRLMFHCIVMVVFIVLSVTCIILYRFSGDVKVPVE